ncbi:hypothetical protein BC828DRAFT_274786 [Blastocladiella britannica]|nr:hypothetical protein BC828DRAFT_274786 [Blastocladiella britannica]
MRRLLKGRITRSMVDSVHERCPVTIPPHAFEVPALLEYMYSRRRLAAIAKCPLVELVQLWDSPYSEPIGSDDNDDDDNDDDNGNSSSDSSSNTGMRALLPSPALAKRLAEPKLRLVPEGLQLPSFFLFASDVPQFKHVVQLLLAGVPSLKQATAPLRLWLRMGIDDRNYQRTELSLHCDGGSDEPDPALEEPITLPMYWGLVAAMEGLTEALDFLVTVGAMDLAQWIRWVSLPKPSCVIIHGFREISGTERAIPTWHWLVSHGYVFPEDDCGLTVMILESACDYETFRHLFLEHDVPVLRAIEDPLARFSRYREVVWRFQDWLVHGHYDLLPVLMELELLDDTTVYMFLEYIYETDDLPSYHGKPLEQVLPAIMNAYHGMDRLDEVLDEGATINLSTAVGIACSLDLEHAIRLVNRHVEQPGLLDAVNSLPLLHQHVDLDALVDKTLGTLSDEEENMEDRENDFATIIMYAAHDGGTVGQAAARGLAKLSPFAHVQLFAWAIASLISQLHDSVRHIPALENAPPPPPAADGSSSSVVKVALEKLLPPALETVLTADKASSMHIDDLIHMGTSHSAESTYALSNDGWARLQDLSATDIALLDLLEHDPFDVPPIWGAARLALSVPAYVLDRVDAGDERLLWVWRLYLDAIKRDVKPAPIMLDSWSGYVRDLFLPEDRAAVRLVLQIMHQLFLKGRLPTYKAQIRYLIAQHPPLASAARSAGFDE